MTAFNYRAYNLELDVCDSKHGFWLDEGEAVRVREIVEERVAGPGARREGGGRVGQLPRRPQGRRTLVLGSPHRQGLNVRGPPAGGPRASVEGSDSGRLRCRARTAALAALVLGLRLELVGLDPIGPPRRRRSSSGSAHRSAAAGRPRRATRTPRLDRLLLDEQDREPIEHLAVRRQRLASPGQRRGR